MNAVIYARYSSHGQTEQSIEGQLHDNYAFAARQGYTVVGEYIDRARTGTSDNRDDFQRMIRDAQKKQFEAVIVWKLDRFARNRYDSAVYKSRLKKCGVRVLSAMENVTDSPEGIILEGLLESMAEYYSANLSVNVRRGQRETVSKGRFPGGTVPYGYRVQEGKLVPDERSAPIVRFVFERYAAGVPKKEIIGELTARGVVSPNGRPLSLSSYQRLLPNPVYVGRFMWGGTPVEGCATPIVDQETFDRVQQRLKQNAHAPGRGRAAVEYALHGKLFCGHCGSPMVGESGYGRLGVMYHYYACAAHKKSHSCPKRNERMESLESYVIRRTVEYVLAPDNARKIAAAVVAEYNREFSDNRVESMERAVAQIDREIDNLVSSLATVPRSAHQRIGEKLEQLEAQKADLESDAAKLRVAARIRLTEQEVLAWLNTFSSGDPSSPAFRRRVVDTFINSIYVYDDRAVIFYNIHRDKQVTFHELSSASLPLPSSPPSSAPLSRFGYASQSYAICNTSEPQLIFVSGVFGYIFWEDVTKRSEC